MMKKIKLFTVAITLLSIACADQNAFMLVGEITDAGLNGKTVYLQKINEKQNGLTTIDSTTVENGKFSFKGIANEQPDVRFVVIQGERGNRIFLFWNAEKSPCQSTPLPR
jgi:hypothetical protein